MVKVAASVAEVELHRAVTATGVVVLIEDESGTARLSGTGDYDGTPLLYRR